MLVEIQVNRTRHKVYALDNEYRVMAEFPVSTDFYPGYNENGEAYGNAPAGVYRDENVWAESKGQFADEPAYGWGYLNLDIRGRALHGGGSNLDDPYAPFQELTPTLGCYRMHNADIFYLTQLFLESVRQGFKPCVHIVD